MCREPGMKLDVLETDSLGKITAISYGQETSPKVCPVSINLVQLLTSPQKPSSLCLVPKFVAF